MTPAQALAFVEQHGVVLEAAFHNTIPALTERIAGEPLRVSWWSHPSGRVIFSITRALRESDLVLVCRLVDDKITFVHARCWPALIHLAERFPAPRLARLHEVHGGNGRHRIETTPFPDWVSPSTSAAARRLTESEASATLGMLSSLLETSS